MDREGEAPAEPKPTHRVGVRRRLRSMPPAVAELKLA
jgi:hypothetical protein